MGRRTVLLIVATLIAAMGTSLVFLYVRGVDARANERFDAVQVLKAVEVIGAGETLAEAQAAGKIEMGTVPRGGLLSGATTSVADMQSKVALTNILPGEQIVRDKFGSPGDQEVLNIPDAKMAISVNLTDPARVAGFVNPGAEVAIFVSAEPESFDLSSGDSKKLPQFTRLLLPRVPVIGVGTTTLVSTTTTTTDGEQTTEELPRTLLTLAVNQEDAEKILFAARNGEVAFALLTEDSEVRSSAGITASNVFE